MHEFIAYPLPWLLLTFILAGLVKGVTGMGLPTVAMGLLGLYMPPASAAALLVLPSLVTNLWQLLAGPDFRRLLGRLKGMMGGIVLGTVAGSAVLTGVNPVWSGLGLGLALIFYSVWALLAPAWVIPPGRESWLSPLMGLLTGLVTGATGVFVMPAVPYLQALSLEREQLIQALGLSFTVSTLALAAGLLTHGAFHGEQLGASLLAVLPALVGMGLGQLLRRAMSPRHFRMALLICLTLLGLELVLRPLSR